MGRFDMWAFLIFIVVANCNAELHPKETAALHPKNTVGLPTAESRIVGGNDTTIEKYPFAVQIYYQPKTLNRCGGSLVSTKHVLTAAACFFSSKGQHWQLNMLSDYTIRASTTLLNSGGSVHTIAAIKVHEQFNFTSREHNVAVVQINAPVDESTSVARPVFFTAQDSVVPDNSFVTAVGWGWSIYKKNTETTFLNALAVPKINVAACKARYMKAPTRKLPKNSICTGLLDVKPGKSPCNGDIGGALLYKEKVVGITSFSPGVCNDSEFPFVYVQVASYTNWINEKINDTHICSSEIPEEIRVYGRTGSPSNQASSQVGAMTLVTPILYLTL